MLIQRRIVQADSSADEHQREAVRALAARHRPKADEIAVVYQGKGVYRVEVWEDGTADLYEVAV